MHATTTTRSTDKKSARNSEKTEQTKSQLLASGVRLFSTFGYNATSTRSVETDAEVQRNLITYHFGSKESFWKACVRQLFDRFIESLRPSMEQAKDIEPVERIRFLIRKFVRASATYPEVMRIMFDEGRCDDWRLSWIVEQYTRGFHGTVCDLLDDGRACGALPKLSPMQFYYVLVSSGAMFAMAPECRKLSSEEPFDESTIDHQADAIAALLAPGGGL